MGCSARLKLCRSSPDNRFRLVLGDCLEFMRTLPEESIDMIFADPPYFLSNGGITCRNGKMTTVDKGAWDRSRGIKQDYEFQLSWLVASKRLLKPNGTIWVSGTLHSIFIVGFAMQELGFKLLNNITWYKRNPPPNLSCRYFTHATETLIWAARDKNSRHCFNYKLMKELNGGKQMQSLWAILPPRKSEKEQGKHPTQKPLALLERIVLACTCPGDLVLDPFAGSGTTGLAAYKLGRRFIGVEIEEEYFELAWRRFMAMCEKESVGQHSQHATTSFEEIVGQAIH